MTLLRAASQFLANHKKMLICTIVNVREEGLCVVLAKMIRRPTMSEADRKVQREWIARPCFYDDLCSRPPPIVNNETSRATVAHSSEDDDERLPCAFVARESRLIEHSAEISLR